MRHLKAIMAASALLACCGSALAQDIDVAALEPKTEYQPVEAGSNWYLRGDIGYAYSNEFDSARRMSDADIVPVAASVGAGYQFNEFLRGELNLGLLPSMKDECATSATCGQGAEVKVRAYDFMANAYFDLGTVAGFTPYIGGGLGALYVDSKYSGCDAGCGTAQDAASNNNFNLAYSLGAGVSYKLSDRMALDLGYEYKAAPSATYFAFNDQGGVFEEKGLDFHQVKLGLRFGF